MAKGTNNKTKVAPVEDKPLLSEEQVWSIIEYARSYSGGIYGATILTPDLVSARMQDITLNPMAATQAMLDKALTSPKSSEKELQEFSQNFELSSMIYKKLISYLADMLAFDVTYTANAEPDDYDTPKYKKDLKAVESFLEKFEYKKELRLAVKEMLRNDAFFACFMDTGNQYVLQELPSEYCKITGRWEGGFLFSFNMYWFLQPGVSLDMYPPFFTKKYKELWGDGDPTRTYNPSLPPEARSRSTWIYWVDVPTTLGVCFKLTPELATRLPYFSPLFNDLILQPLMRNLQKNMNMAAASKLIMGEVPMLDKTAKATVKDSIAISPDLLGKFMSLVKSAISEAIKVASAPLTNMKGISFDTEVNMYDSFSRTVYALSGVNTNLIFTSNVKPNAIETQLSLNVDEQMMEGLYPQFEDFMNYFIGKLTKTFKFRLAFEGTDFFLDRDSRFEKAMALFEKGIIMPQKISAALGMKPADFRRHMEEAAAQDFMKKLTPPMVANQIAVIKAQPKPPAPGGAGVKPPVALKEPAGSAGRPKKPASKLGEEGAQTRATGANVSRGGKPR
jgi:hypothetical protein